MTTTLIRKERNSRHSPGSGTRGHGQTPGEAQSTFVRPAWAVLRRLSALLSLHAAEEQGSRPQRWLELIGIPSKEDAAMSSRIVTVFTERRWGKVSFMVRRLRT